MCRHAKYKHLTCQVHIISCGIILTAGIVNLPVAISFAFVWLHVQCVAYALSLEKGATCRLNLANLVPSALEAGYAEITRWRNIHAVIGCYGAYHSYLQYDKPYNIITQAVKPFV